MKEDITLTPPLLSQRITDVSWKVRFNEETFDMWLIEFQCNCNTNI